MGTNGNLNRVWIWLERVRKYTAELSSVFKKIITLIYTVSLFSRKHAWIEP